MSKFLRLCLFLGLAITIFGVIFLGIAVKAGSFENDKLETTEYIIDKTFNSIDIDMHTMDISIIKATDGKNKIVAKEKEKLYCDYDVEDNTLKITEENKLKWYEKMINFSFKSPKVSIYLANDTYDKLVINSNISDVSVSNVSFNNIDIKNTTGDTIFNDLNVGDSLIVKSTTGDTKLNNVIVTNDLNIKHTTGDIRFSKTDAKNISFVVTTGDIKGNILTSKKFDCKTTTGDIKVPVSESDKGLCFCRATTGDIKITITAA